MATSSPRLNAWKPAPLLEKLADPDYAGRPERALLFEIEAWDVNCPQHIAPRFSEEQIRPAVAGLQARIVQLEEEVAALRARLGDGRSER